MPQCTKCGEWKDDDDFPWKNRLFGIRHRVCKACTAERSRDWYEGHREEHKENVKRNRDQAREDARYFVFDYLSNSVCKECGEYRPEMLQFHHTGRKKMDISAMASQGYSIEAIRREITQCIVLCANCHQMLEHKRRRGD